MCRAVPQGTDPATSISHVTGRWILRRLRAREGLRVGTPTWMLRNTRDGIRTVTLARFLFGLCGAVTALDEGRRVTARGSQILSSTTTPSRFAMIVISADSPSLWSLFF